MTRLSTLFVGVMLLGIVNAAQAQDRGLRSAEGRSVFVIDANRQEWQGRLLNVTVDALEVENDAGLRSFKLAEIRRVDADGDGVWDGAFKGAATGALLGLLGAAATGAPVWTAATSAMAYGLLGMAIDGGCSSRHPVYHGAAIPSAPEPSTANGPAMRVSMRLRW